LDGRYYINGINEKERWIYIEKENSDFEEADSFVEFLTKIKDKYPEKIICVGEGRYKFEKAKIDLIYQWDNLFGIVVEYPKNCNEKDVIDFLSEFLK